MRGRALRRLAKLIFRKDSVDERDQMSSFSVGASFYSSVLGLEIMTILSGLVLTLVCKMWAKDLAFGFKTEMQ